MKTVLVVEDNADNLQIITYALQRAGYEVISAETGENGVANGHCQPSLSDCHGYQPARD